MRNSNYMIKIVMRYILHSLRCLTEIAFWTSSHFINRILHISMCKSKKT